MSEKVDILAIGAHPDDIELGCGATIIKEIEMGKKVGLIDLTQGELGTRGNKEIRKKEAELSKNEMGAVFRDNLLLDDCFFENNRDNQIKLISKIRRYKPKLFYVMQR
jgi:LmbE family N-acetylglucosaminyl deacetylase